MNQKQIKFIHETKINLRYLLIIPIMILIYLEYSLYKSYLVITSASSCVNFVGVQVKCNASAELMFGGLFLIIIVSLTVFLFNIQKRFTYE